MNAARKNGRTPVSSRRTHRKSRLGCANCKRRRIKCDEQKPACTNCLNHAIRCDFLTASPSNASGTASPGYFVSPSATSPLNFGSPVSPSPTVTSCAPDLNIVELELMHHYVNSTCATLPGGLIGNTMWKRTVPQMGFADHYILQLILAMSAHHLARQQPERQLFLRSLAEEYHDAALQTVSSILPSLDASNCEPLYLSAIIISTLFFARGPAPGDYLMISDRGVSEWLIMNRGTRSIMEMQKADLFSGKLSGMFRTAAGKLRVAFATGPVPHINQHVTNFRQFLVSLAVSDPNASTYVETFDRAIRSLHPILEGVKAGDQSDLSVFLFSWLYCLEESFIVCLHEHQPIALIIMAYFVVMVHAIQNYWFMEGWPDHIMTGIFRFLPDEYKLWIQWPAEQIGWAS